MALNVERLVPEREIELELELELAQKLAARELAPEWKLAIKLH